MAKIFEMPPHLADLIAAGEVVERPGSVVKELLENAIDAGANSVTVEIKSGGMAMIRVTDNGCGIASEDVETAFLRHATSKLRSERDLEAIGTLGFRGEALAAIASVSRIELLTREKGAPEGTRLLLEGGVKREKAPAGAPEGTTVIVRDLFFNTPARQKFMKNDRAEGANVTTVLVRLALSHPEVSIRYIKEGKEELHTPGDGRLQSAAYCALGRDFAKGLLEAENQQEGLRVTGFVSTPAAARGNRAWQFFFINGRTVKSKLLQAAVEQAYKNSLFTGRFPVCVLNISMGLSGVDVNVHPTKMEVRFVNERLVFDAVYWAVRGALEREEKPKELELSPSTKNALRASPLSVKDVAGSNVFAPPSKSAPSSGGFLSGAASVKPRDDFFKSVSAGDFRKEPSVRSFQASIPAVSGKREASELHDSARPERSEPPSFTVRGWETMRLEPEESEEPFRYVGEALRTYLIVERGDSLFLIDKHAAHERILFDKLKSEKREIPSQTLLSPIVCPVGEEAAETLAENAALLAEFGFEIDDFGGGSVAIRCLPADIEPGDASAYMEELAGILKNGGRRDMEALRDEVLHSVACKAAIKAGKRSEPEEVQRLIGRVLSGEIKYCPHGRPVSVELTKRELDKSFKRV